MVFIAHCVGLNRPPALPLPVRAWMTPIDDGHGNDILLVSADQNTIMAWVPGVAWFPGVARICRHTFFGKDAMPAVAKRPCCTETLVCLDFDLPVEGLQSAGGA